MQVVHSRRPTTSVRVKEEGMFKKKQMLQVSSSGAVEAGSVLSLDFAPGKLESQVRLRALLPGQGGSARGMHAGPLACVPRATPCCALRLQAWAWAHWPACCLDPHAEVHPRSRWHLPSQTPACEKEGWLSGSRQTRSEFRTAAIWMYLSTSLHRIQRRAVHHSASQLP